MDAGSLRGVFMADPKDVRIAELEATVAGLKAQLAPGRGQAS